MSNKSGSRLAPEERRSQILGVAAEHFARYGVIGTSVSAVAKAAGVARALVYHYFPGKEDLLRAVLESEADQLLADTDIDPSLSPRDNAEAALRAYLARFHSASGGLRELYATGDPAGISTVVERSRSTHIERILALTGAEDTPATRRSLHAWLVFVTAIGQDIADAGPAEQGEAIGLCLSVLATVLGRDLEATDTGS